MVDIKRLYSDRAGKMRKSVIRELLKVTQDPEIISFAGGLPNPNSFPVQATGSPPKIRLPSSLFQIEPFLLQSRFPKFCSLS